MTEQYTHNLNVLERVLYDGQGFCLPLERSARRRRYDALIPNARYSADCKHYMQHALGPAFMLVPLVLLFGPRRQPDADLGAAGWPRPRSSSMPSRAVSDRPADATGADRDGHVRHDLLVQRVRRRGVALRPRHGGDVPVRRDLRDGQHAQRAACRGLHRRGLHLPAVDRSWPAFSRWSPLPTCGWSSGPGVALLRRIRLRPLVSLALGVAPFLVLTGIVNCLASTARSKPATACPSRSTRPTSSLATYNHGIFDSQLHRSPHPGGVRVACPIFSGQGAVRLAVMGWPGAVGHLAGAAARPVCPPAPLPHGGAARGALALVLAGAVMLIAVLRPATWV